MVEIVSHKEFDRLKEEYRIYILAAILFSSVIGFAVGLSYSW